jgi:hypothetical protein
MTGSRHEIEDTVILNFYNSGKITGKICGVRFTDYGKVLYDVKIRPFVNEPQNEKFETVVKEIDSYFVETEWDQIIQK